MYNQVIFFNGFGAGDIFESREFVKTLTKMIPADRYYYSHGKHPRILLDMPELKFIPFDDRMNNRRQIWEDSGTLFVNTWIGITGQYLLPGIGCTVEGLFRMYNDILGFLNLSELPGSPIDYIPDIDYNYYQTNIAMDFIRKTDGISKVYIDNGLVQSMQAENFSMNPIVLALTVLYPNKIFICAQPFKNNRPNLEFVGEFAPGIGFDLNEASFLSLYCDILIGRNSGPHVFTQVRKNVMDEYKKLLSFTYHPQGSSFVVNTPVKIEKFWSGSTSESDVIRDIERVLND